MIEIKHLRKKYARGKEVISDLNLSFDEVGLNIIVGKSGCGKTTLINILGGMDRDYEGIVSVDGHDLNELNYTGIADYRNFISAFVFQKNSLFEFLTVEDNLKLCLDIQNNEANISEALERVGLAGFEKKKVKALSGGEKQRVAIARALIKDCKIIFADEPTSALDSKNAHRIFQLFKELSKDKLVVLVTHDVKKASLYADRMVRLVDGFVEEDVVYNKRTETSKELPDKKSKPFSLRPILAYHLKTGMVINIFVIAILIIGFAILSITNSQKAVKQEYDFYGTSNQVKFDDKRALKTQADNNIDLYDVVKKGDANMPFYYIENVDNGDVVLDNADRTILGSALKGVDTYEGTSDLEYKNLIIEKISKYTKASTKVNEISVYWRTYSPSNFTYYVYNKNNKYDLTCGRLPENENEILVTDTVADYYLRRRAKDPGDALQSVIGTYDVDLNDILLDTYKAYPMNESLTEYNGYEVYEDEDGRMAVDLPNEFVIYDAYSQVTGSLGGTYTYYMYEKKVYKVVGVINTGLLNFYTYNSDSERYYLLENFKTQSGSEEYMNSFGLQPNGYVVLQKPLGGRYENHNYNDSFDIVGMYYDGNLISNKVSAFSNEYDYTGLGLAGNNDNIKSDLKDRIISLSTTSTELKDDEIILSVNAVNAIYNRNFTNTSVKTFFETIKNSTLSLTFVTNSKIVKKDLKIVGVSKKSCPDYYAGYDLYDELYSAQNPNIPSLTVNLDKLGYLQRYSLMEKLYDLGYCLNPIEQMPGAYLEFVEGKGEMLAEVDYDGLASLYPNYEALQYDDLVEEYPDLASQVAPKHTYFVVNGEVFGEISGEYVYMKSSLIRNVQLDESYYTTVGNLSPYYLYSMYYNDEGAMTGNSILEVMDSLSTFFLAVAVVLAIGFIYLKEFRQRESITKLSMLGVRNKDLVALSILTYIPFTIIIGLLSIATTYLVIVILNNLYSYGFDANIVLNSGKTIVQHCDISRVRLMFDISTVYTTIIASLIIGVVMLVSSIVITLKSRK